MSIRPGKQAGAPTVPKLRALWHSSLGGVHFKLSFNEDAL